VKEFWIATKTFAEKETREEVFHDETEARNFFTTKPENIRVFSLVEKSAYRELESKLARIYKSVEKLNAANKKYESLRMSPSLVFGAVNKLCALVDKERGWQTTG
jgi:hypothetical protein